MLNIWWLLAIFLRENLHFGLSSTLQTSLKIAHDWCLFALLAHTRSIVDVAEDWDLGHSLLRIENLVNLSCSSYITRPARLFGSTALLPLCCLVEHVVLGGLWWAVLLDCPQCLWALGLLIIPLECERPLRHLPLSLDLGVSTRLVFYGCTAATFNRYHHALLKGCLEYSFVFLGR